MENFLPFTEDVMVVLVHKCAQQTHLLALHLETLGYIPRLLNALNDLVYFSINVILLFSFLSLKVVWVSTIPRQAINTPVIKMTSQYESLKAKEGITNASDNPNG